jgi:hypothetical protein
VRPRPTDAEDGGQADFESLLIGDVYAGNTH